MIRTAIREEQEHYRHRNVAKLLFMHMLGEWAMLEACVAVAALLIVFCAYTHICYQCLCKLFIRKCYFSHAISIIFTNHSTNRLPHPLWPIRMHEASRLPPLSRKTHRLPGHDAPPLRTARSPHARDQLAQK